MKRKLILLAALLAATALPGQTSEPLKVTAVRFWSLSEVTRVVIEVSGEFQYQPERLHNPERLFFDILRARPVIEGRRSHNTAVNDKLVKRIRVAQTLPGVTRVVFDLAGSVDFTCSALSNPDRLIVELRPAPPPAIPLVSELPVPPVVPALANLPASVPALVIPRVERAPSPLEAPLAEPLAKPETSKPAAVPPARTASAKPAGPMAPPTPAETGKAAKPTSDGGNSLIRALGLKVTRVVLDAGHGGHDQGTVGPRGLTEKELVLDVAKRLGKLIEDRMGSEVIYTRSDDTFIPLEGRTTLANEKKADLFLSLHANSSPSSRIAGVETFYLNFANTKDALDVAARENASSQKSVYELQDLIKKITLNEKIEESKELAGRLQTSLFAFETRYHSGVKDRGVKKAPFVVLIGASMPSVLAEIGFLSNPREEALLRRPEHRQRLAEALYRGVHRYAQSLSHFQMAQAPN